MWLLAPPARTSPPRASWSIRRRAAAESAAPSATTCWSGLASRDTQERVAVELWKSLGFEIIGTVPGAFRHAEDGYVALHVMFRRITPT
jgi:hypothetical protein